MSQLLNRIGNRTEKRLTMKTSQDVKKDETGVARVGAGSDNVGSSITSPFERLNELRAMSRARERDSLTSAQRAAFGSLVQFTMGACKDRTQQCHDWAMDETNSYCIHWYEAMLHHCAPALFAFFESNDLNANNGYIQYVLSVTYYNQHPIEALDKYMRRQLKRAAQKLNLEKVEQ